MKRINYLIETDYLRFEDVTFDIQENQLIYDLDTSSICFGVAEKPNRSKVNGIYTPILSKKDLVITNTKTYAEVGMPLHETDNTIDRRSSFLFLEIDKLKFLLDRYWSEEQEKINDVPEESFQYKFNDLQVFFDQPFLTNKLLNFKELMFVNDLKMQQQLVEAKLEEFLIFCLQTNSRKQLFHLIQEHNYIDNPINFIIHLIVRNPEKNWTVSELSQKANVSLSSVHRYFQKVLGMSPVSFITNNKMKVAKKLLDERIDLSVQEVGERVGIKNTTYFSKVFKKNMGVSPNVYKKQFLK